MKKKIAIMMLSGVMAISMMSPSFAAISFAAKAPVKAKTAAQKKDATEEQKDAPEIKKIKKAADGVAEFEEIDRWSSNPEFKAYGNALYKDKTTRILVNGTEYKYDYSAGKDNIYEFSAIKGLRIGSGSIKAEGENTLIIRAEGYKDKTLKFKDNGENYEITSQENAGVTIQPKEIEDPTEEGDYTLKYVVTTPGNSGNKASASGKTVKQKKEGETQGTNMIAKVFDSRAHLKRDKQGKMTVSMLNIKAGEYLIDCAIGKGDNLKRGEKKEFGKKNSSGKAEAWEYTFEIENIGELKTMAVLVGGPMGGSAADVGKYEQYRKANIQFIEIKKDWSEYEHGQDFIDRTVEKVLLEKYDLDSNGKLDENEINKMPEDLDLSGEKITDVSYLSNLGDKIKKLNLIGNRIETLPDDMLSKMTNLEVLKLGNNMIKKIPDGFFKNNGKLREIFFGGNEISELKASQFKGLTALTRMDFMNAGLKKLDPKLLVETPKLKEFAVNMNYIGSLSDDFFKPVAGTLNFIDVSNNDLKKLTNSLNSCKKMDKIYAYANRISYISNIDFSKMPELSELHLMKNRVSSLKSKIFAKNLKLNMVDFHDNQLSSISADVLPKDKTEMHKFDFTLNNIKVADPKFTKKLKDWYKVQPQKLAMGLVTEQKGNTIKWSQNMSILDLRHWYDITASDKAIELETPAMYREEIKRVYGNKKIEDILKEKGRGWKILITLEKKNSKGEFEQVKNSERVIDNKADSMSGSYKISGKDTYRVVKTLYMSGKKINNRDVEVISVPKKKPAVPNKNINKIKKVKIAKVKKLKAKNKRKRMVVLTWKKLTGVTGYKIYRATKKNGKYKLVKTVKGSKKVKFINKKLKKGKKYYYKIRAYKKVGKKTFFGKYSNLIKIIIRR